MRLDFLRRDLDLLLVDDDPGQLRLMQRLLSELGLLHRCHYAPNGRQALDFLARRPPYEAAPRPHLILLDVNMPGLHGCEVLHQIKSNPGLHTIPVIMLSTSIAAGDVNACYTEHANAYIQKPPDLDGNLNLLRQLDRFWAIYASIPG